MPRCLETAGCDTPAWPVSTRTVCSPSRQSRSKSVRRVGSARLLNRALGAASMNGVITDWLLIGNPSQVPHIAPLQNPGFACQAGPLSPCSRQPQQLNQTHPMEPLIGAAQQTAGADLIKNSSTAAFMADVIDASNDQPVIVDFWAPWCGPCKTLGPALEAAVDAAGGAVKLVKVNIDENPEIAQQLRIQSIPTVYAFKAGQPVDGFMGAIPESQVKAFVATLAGGEAGHGHGGPDHAAEVLKIANDSLAADDIGTAAQAYGHLLQDEPGHPQAVAGLARCYLKSGDLDRAKATLQLVRPDGANDEAM